MKYIRIPKTAILLLAIVLCLSGAVYGQAKKTAYQAMSEGLLGKYSPEINLTAWRYLYAGMKFKTGDDISHNVYIDMYKEKFGINLTYVWTVPEEQFEQKLNISVAAGDLPDLMWLNNKALVDLAENGLLADLTTLFKTKTSALTQSIMQEDQGSFDTAKVGGKLVALPYTGSAVDSLQILFYRTDWAKNLGLSEPKTMQDLLAMAKAFTEKDPDKNGKADTFGLALTKNFIKDNHAGVTGFFAGYHAYIDRWTEGSSGRLVYGSVTPEAKTALKALQDMYKAGLLDQEFGVKDRAKVTESVVAGKVGITYGGMSTPGGFLKNNVINDPNAEWKAIPLVSADSKPALPIAKMPVNRYFGMNKKSKNPEAIMKLIESGTAGYSRDPADASPEDNAKYGVTPDGISVFQYAVVGYEPALKNLNAHKNVLKAISSQDTSILNSEEKGYYDRIMRYRNENDRNTWDQERIFGTPSSFDVVQQHVEKIGYTYNQFYTSMTPTMVERMATLDALQIETFTKIIMGQPIDTFDKFVQDWYTLGGTQITKEVNDWAAKKK